MRRVQDAQAELLQGVMGRDRNRQRERRGSACRRAAAPRRSLVAGLQLAADRGACRDDARRPRADVRHEERRHADGILLVRPLGSDGGAERRPHDVQQRHRHGYFLQLAGHHAGVGRHSDRRRRQLDRHGHDQYRQQQQQRLRHDGQHADARREHESRALVLVLDGARQRRDLHSGRQRRR